MDIKWVYYQYMDYFKTNKYFQDKLNVDPFADKFLNSNRTQTFIIDKDLKNKQNNSTLVRESKIVNINEVDSSMSNNFGNTLYKIISEKPQNWNLNGNSNSLTLDNYRDIRRKLLFQVKAAWKSKRFNDAKIILARSNRYKEEINKLLENHKMNLFAKNNMSLVYEKGEAFIDLHGLNYDESLLIVKRKINDIINNKQSKMNLNIITGRGTHSNNRSPVLLPRLSEYFKSTNLKYKVDSSYGQIKVMF